MSDRFYSHRMPPAPPAPLEQRLLVQPAVLAELVRGALLVPRGQRLALLAEARAQVRLAQGVLEVLLAEP